MVVVCFKLKRKKTKFFKMYIHSTTGKIGLDLIDGRLVHYIWGIFEMSEDTCPRVLCGMPPSLDYGPMTIFLEFLFYFLILGLIVLYLENVFKCENK